MQNKLLLEKPSSFEFDSRAIQPGSLFFALKGDTTDGHNYLSEVSKKGAWAAVVSKTYQGPDFGLKLFAVEDPLTTLQELAHQKVLRVSPTILAITGSVGKTTTKEFLKTLLEQRFKLFYTLHNQNTQISLPHALLNRLTPSTEVCVVEMGMTHPKNLVRLVQLAPPTLAILTTVQPVHGVNFSSFEDLLRAKCEIFSHPKTTWALTEDSLKPYVPKHLERLSIVTVPQEILSLFSLPGRHNRYLFALATTVAKQLGLSWEEIKERTPHLCLPEKRLELLSKKGVTFINDSYNASLVSMQAALQVLRETPGKKRVALLGEMKELGPWSHSHHEQVFKEAISSADLCYFLGEAWAPSLETFQGKQALHFSTKKALEQAFYKEVQPGDTVLVKGSNSYKMWTFLENY